MTVYGESGERLFDYGYSDLSDAGRRHMIICCNLEPRQTLG